MASLFPDTVPAWSSTSDCASSIIFPPKPPRSPTLSIHTPSPSLNDHDPKSSPHHSVADAAASHPINAVVPRNKEDFDTAIQQYLNGNYDQHFPDDDSLDGDSEEEEDDYEDEDEYEVDHKNNLTTSNTSHQSPEAEISWDLRIAPRQLPNKAFNSTWIDNDESGDYDPSKGDGVWAILQSQAKRKRPQELIYDDDDGGGDGIGEANENATVPKKYKPRSYLMHQRRGDHLVAKLKLNGDAGREILQKYPDNWPLEESWNVFDDEQSIDINGDEPYQLRNRPIKDVLEDRTAYAHHPEARGCISCLSLGLRCSLLDPESAYPCDDCAGDGFECELVIPSKFKRACEHCKSRRKRCSYTQDGDHGQPCNGCQESGWKCVAGPAVDPTRVRIGHDGKPVILYGGGRRTAVSCTPCKQLKKTCSIRGGDQPPCANCRLEGEDCHFNRSRSRRQPKKGKSREKVKVKPTKSRRKMVQTTEEVTMNKDVMQPVLTEPLAQPKPLRPRSQELQVRERPRLVPHLSGKVRYIKTKLAHPITFNAVQTTKSQCHWCIDPIIGLFGIGQGIRRVRVIQWPDGKGYTELSGGLTNEGLEPCRMCGDCTLQRIFITLCPSHVMRPMQNPPLASLNMGQISTQLLNCRKPEEVHRSYELFCSVCPSVAFFECCTDHDTSMFTDHRRPKNGCGLRLCRTCRMIFEDVYSNDLQLMLDQMVPHPTLYKHGLRPDSDFFKANSQLLKQIGY